MHRRDFLAAALAASAGSAFAQGTGYPARPIRFERRAGIQASGAR